MDNRKRLHSPEDDDSISKKLRQVSPGREVGGDALGGKCDVGGMGNFGGGEEEEVVTGEKSKDALEKESQVKISDEANEGISDSRDSNEEGEKGSASRDIGDEVEVRSVSEASSTDSSASASDSGSDSEEGPLDYIATLDNPELALHRLDWPDDYDYVGQLGWDREYWEYQKQAYADNAHLFESEDEEEEEEEDEGESDGVASDDEGPDDEDSDDESSDDEGSDDEGSGDEGSGDQSSDSEGSGDEGPDNEGTSRGFPDPQYLVPHFAHLASRIDPDEISAPTVADPNPKVLAHQALYSTFHPFPRLPAEIRLKIWGMGRIQPHVLHVKYMHESVAYRFQQQMSGTYRVCNWIFENKKNPFECLQICQESRFEGLKSMFFMEYERIMLQTDVTQRAWFNFEIDTMLLSTSAGKVVEDEEENGVGQGRESRDDGGGVEGYNRNDQVSIERYDTNYRYDSYNIYRAYVQQASENPHGPPDCPLSRQTTNKLRFLSVSANLWYKWPFASDHGSEISCEMCGGFGIDQSLEKFRDSILKDLRSIERISIWTDRFVYGEQLRLVETDEVPNYEREKDLKELKSLFLQLRQWNSTGFDDGDLETLEKVVVDVVDLEVR